MINIKKISGWLLICPNCGFEKLISDEDIAFNPTDDLIHIVLCENCNQDFEIQPKERD